MSNLKTPVIVSYTDALLAASFLADGKEATQSGQRMHRLASKELDAVIRVLELCGIRAILHVTPMAVNEQDSQQVLP